MGLTGSRYSTAWVERGPQRVVFLNVFGYVFFFSFIALFRVDIVRLTIPFFLLSSDSSFFGNCRPQRRVCHVDQLVARRDPHTSDRDRHAPSPAQRPHHELFFTGTSRAPSPSPSSMPMFRSPSLVTVPTPRPQPHLVSSLFRLHAHRHL